MNAPTVNCFTASAPLRVGFIGLGVMGGPMAGHLLRAGHAVTAFNRTPSRAAAWLAKHPQARTAATPKEAAQGADVVCVCVGRDDDVRAVVTGREGALHAMKAGGLLIDHTTASASLARELGHACEEREVAFIDAPVSGGEVGAQNGQLAVMCGGDAAAIERGMPVLSSYAKLVQRVGPIGSGQLAKMCNQICIAGTVQGLSEAIAFGQQAGLDMSVVLQAIGGGAAQSWQMRERGPTMIEDRFDFGFAVDWMRKDLGLVLDEARRCGARVPLAALVDQFYADVQAMGGGGWDTSSLIRRLR